MNISDVETHADVGGGRPDPLGAIQGELDALWLIHPQVPDDVRIQMSIAAGEIGANIVEHTGSRRPVRIRMGSELVGDQVHVAFTDDGPPVDIDLTSVSMPEEMDERGRGLAMAQGVLGLLAYRCDDLGNHWELISRRFAVSTAVSVLSEALAASETARALLKACTDAMIDPQVLLEAVRDPGGRVVDFVYLSANRATLSDLGLSDEEELIGVSAVNPLPGGKGSGLLSSFVQCLEDGTPLSLNGFPYFNEMLGEVCRYDIRTSRAGAELLAMTWSDVTDRFRHEERLGRSERKFRRMMDNAAVGMCLTTSEGRFVECNDAMCHFFGYGAEVLMQMRWQELTAAGYLDADLVNIGKITSGQIDSYRLTKQFIHADGHLIWGDQSMGCLRSPNGDIERFIAQITDITTEVTLAQHLQMQSDRLAAELHSAATYMASIMPHGLHGAVTVSSRYLPSRELGGDSFDYQWIDDDHLLVYLIDVSGHGIEPALLSVSVHNMLRSRLSSTKTLLTPEAVLTELNDRFQMELHDEHYFTMWYGVYEASSRTLRYASAGAPPALAFDSATGTDVVVTELPTGSAPVGMFEDTVFTSRTYAIPPGCRILVYSDGASEVTLADDRQMRWADFKDLTSRVAAAPDWTLDGLIDELTALAPSGAFDDDCSLIQLTFDHT